MQASGRTALVDQVRSDLSLEPGVVLSSGNIAHYHHTALALHQAGYLRHYLCSVGVRRGGARLFRFLPAYWRMKLEGRELPDVPLELVRTIPWAEALTRILLEVRLISSERRNWLFNHLYDRMAQKWVKDCDVFHFVSTVGLYSARRVKSQGGIAICDIRAAYPDHRRQLARDEYECLGLQYQSVGQLQDGRAKAEYALADHLIVPSEYAKTTFTQAGFSPLKISVVPYGVDLQRFRKARDTIDYETGERVFRILYVGRIAPEKGVHYLIRAFQRLNLPSAELLLIGSMDSTMQGLIDDVSQHNPRIRASGHSPHVELCRHYQASSVMVLPSVSDGFGLVILEAMASGLPVIVTTNTGVVIRDGVEGFVIPIRDVEALQERMLWLYEHPQSRREMGQAASERAREFTWQHYGERLLRVYDGILRSERGRMPCKD